MTNVRRLAQSLLFVCLALFSLTASAAVTELRVLFDQNPGGCSVSGMTGVDQVLVTRVTDTDTTANITQTFRQLCVGGSLGAPVDVNNTGWPAGFQPASGQMMVETAIPFTAFGSSAMPPTMRIGLTGTRGADSFSVLTKPNGDPLQVPRPPAGRRHSVAHPGPDRVIILDGLDHDWAGLSPLAEGTAGGASDIKLIKAYSFANPNDNTLYFRFDVKLSGFGILAVDDLFVRTQGAPNLTQPAPGVLGNDIAAQVPLTAVPVGVPDHGDVTLNANGGFTYTPDDPNSVESDVFHYKATHGTDESNVASVSIVVEQVVVAPTITSANSVQLQAGVPANFTVTTTGFPAPAITQTGTLPSGVTFNDNGDGTATIGGTPSIGSGGTYPIVITATNSGGSANQNFTIVVCDAITVLNPATSTGTAGVAFSQTFTQSGAVGGATFSIASGTLPAGLTLATNGVLSGTPTQTGSFPITVMVTDANGCTGTGPTYNLTINCQTITVTNPATTTGTAGAAFSQTFTQAGAIGSATFTIVSGTLPAGLTLAANGTLSGTPTQTGTFPIVVRATDINGCFDDGPTYNLVIGCQTITVTNPAKTTGTAGAAFSQTFTQTGAIGGATFTVVSGTLPAGLTLAANGTLSGTPTQTGPFSIVVRATDINGCFDDGPTYNLTIGCQTITVTNPANANGTVNAAFSETFTQAGAIGGATFTLASGVLPAGLTLATNGVLSGTPTQTGSFPITVTVTDGNGCAGTSATYNLVIACQTITVTNPSNATGPAGSPFSETFTQTGAVGTATFTTASTLPTGLTLSTAGVLSGTPGQGGTFPITVTVTDSNGCTGTGTVYTLVITCPTITVTNPANANGTANAAFSETFTQVGGVGATTFSLASGTLPTGLTLAANGVLSGIPTQTGSFPITVMATDSNGCTGTSPIYNLFIACQTITVNNPANAAGTANVAFSETFTQTGAIGSATFSINSGTLPAGLTLATNGVLSGTPTQTGNFPITVMVTDSNGCTGVGGTYTITIACQTITVNNPANTNGTVSAPFSETFTTTNAIGAVTFSTASALPNGITLSTAGVLSGTPTQDGSFPIVVTVTDGNGCPGTGATYTLVIGCQTITVTNPANTTGTVNAAFSETFTQTSAVGGATFTLNSGVLPNGLTLSTGGVLAGIPTEDGSFPITVLVTDGNGCTGVSATYNLVINCQTITVTNPVNNTGPAGTPFSETFTQTGGILPVTFTTASTLPTGLSLSTGGVLSGTPSQGGSFPIVVTVTDANGCTGTGPSYTLTITCPAITVTNPANNLGTSGVAFSETFTQTGGVGTITWSVTGALPTGITMASGTGILSGTTNQAGVFPITVTATDQNGCTGTGATYNLTINCQTITVTNPGVNTGTVDAAFSQTFTVIGILGTVTWSETGALPAGITLNSATGELSGTPTVNGVFPITVRATDTNGCFDDSPYTLTINCQTITVTNPGVNTGTVDAPFSQTFTQTGAHGTATFTTSSTLPAGLTLATNGVLSGTPTEDGVFPIVVTVTDDNTCTGTSATYNLTINCQTITVNIPGVNTGTTGTPFSQFFTQTGAHGTATFTTASTLPTGFTLNPSTGELSGTTNQHTNFSIVVVVTDSNGCTGTSATYNLTINCQTITVTNPANASGTVNAAFSELFTQTGAIGGATFTTASTLPNGITLSTGGLLAGTPTQSGLFPIVVTVTDGNGCTGTSATYNLNIACNVITVTNPANNLGTAGSFFSETFTQLGGTGTITWSLGSGSLPLGITLDSSTGVLSGTTSQVGNFPITVTATDQNGCSGTGLTYTLTIGCQTITITNPAQTSVQAGTPLSAFFTQTGILGTANWTIDSGTLPTGITLNSSTGELAGTTNQQGSFPVVVKVTDTNGCFDTSSYTLDVVCPVITVARTGGGTFPAGTISTAYTGQSFTGSGGTGPYTFAVTLGALPTGLTLASGGGISGTPTQTGTFTFTVTATDANLCTGSQSFSIAINPAANGDTYNNLVNNTEAVVTGGLTTSPLTPFVPLTGTIIANDLPAAGVAVVAGTFSSANGTNNVVIAADGTFKYTPPVTVAPLASDSFTYTISSNTGGTATPTQAIGTVTLNLANRVWYVKNNGAAGNGQSHSPFNTLAAAQTASTASDIIFVYNGNNTTSGHDAGIVLKDNQHLIGEGVALVVNTHTLVVAGTKPLITHTAGTAVVLANGNTVRGLTITGTSANGISGTSIAGFTGETLTIQGAGAGSSGIVLTTVTGTVTLTGTAISNSPFGLNVNGGTATITADNTNSIASSAGQRSVQIANRASGNITIGATITDGGTGMLVNNNTGGIYAFTGTQTCTTTTSAAVTLTTNAGATINFSGVLGITTTTGSGFVASGGGTLNVSGTATISTGAAANGLSLNGMTVGGTGVAFGSVSTTGATTGIALTNVIGGTVFVNGGTLTNGTTGISLQGALTNLTLTAVTITGPTTGITNTTNFGTLTIVGSAVNVSAASALILTTGAVSGTFNNVTSTGGTNGVNLNAVTGTWGATAGALSGAAGATFIVNGGSGNITWGASISQATAANVVTIATSNSNIINFNGNVSSTGTSTGLSISASSGTYNFNATNVFSGSGGGITISNGQSGTISFSANTTNTTTSTPFTVAGPAAVSANITYSGTINKTSTGTLLNINLLSGSLLFNGTSVVGSSNGAPGVVATVSNVTGTLTVNHLDINSSNNGFGPATLLSISGTNTGGVMTFHHLVLSANGTTAQGAGLVATGGGTVTVTNTGGNSSITTRNAAALTLNGVAIGTTAINSITVAGGAGAYSSVSLTAITSGTLTIGGGSLAGGAGATFLVSGGTVTVTDAGTIAQATAAQPVVSVTGNHTAGTLTFNGAVTATNGTGLQFDNADGTYNFNSATNSLAGGDAGVDILNGSSGSFNFAAGMVITNPTGIAFNVTDSNPTLVDYNGTVTGNNNRAVNVSRAAAGACGTIQFDGAVNSSGASATGIRVLNCSSGSVSFNGNVTLSTQNNAAITLTTNNGATVNFSNGNLSVTTVNGHGIDATCGVAINIAGTDNTLSSSGTGIPLNWAMLTGVHSSGTLRFKSINKSGGATHGAIVRFHNGEFTIHGDDNNNGTPDSATAGGTITGATTRGVEVTDVDGPVYLGGLTITNPATGGGAPDATVATGTCGSVVSGSNTGCFAGIHVDTSADVTVHTVNISGSGQMGFNGRSINNVTMTTVNISNSGTSAQEDGIRLYNLSGSGGMTNVSVTNSFAMNLNISSTTGTLASVGTPFLITNGVLQNAGAQGMLFYLAGNAVSHVKFLNGTVSGNFSNGIQTLADTGSTATLGIYVDNTNISNNGASMAVQASGGTTTFDIQNVDHDRGATGVGHAFTIKGDNTGIANGIFNSNVIGTAAVGSGAACGGGCNGLNIDARNTSEITIEVRGNTVRHVDQNGIAVRGGQGSSKIDATITGNLVMDPDGITVAGIFGDSGVLSPDTNCVTMTIGGNTAWPGSPSVANDIENRIEGTWGSQSIRLRRLFADDGSGFPVFNLPGLVLPVNTFVAGNNSIVTGGTAVGSVQGANGNFTGAASCP